MPFAWLEAVDSSDSSDSEMILSFESVVDAMKEYVSNGEFVVAPDDVVIAGCDDDDVVAVDDAGFAGCDDEDIAAANDVEIAGCDDEDVVTVDDVGIAGGDELISCGGDDVFVLGDNVVIAMGDDGAIPAAELPNAMLELVDDADDEDGDGDDDIEACTLAGRIHRILTSI